MSQETCVVERNPGIQFIVYFQALLVGFENYSL